jgi:hypothetical protein
MDGWGSAPRGEAGYGEDGIPHSASHGRRSALYRHQSGTLFDAFEEGRQNGRPGEAVGLHDLREDSDEEDDEFARDDEEAQVDADERTRLHREASGRREYHDAERTRNSRSHSRSPRIPN